MLTGILLDRWQGEASAARLVAACWLVGVLLVWLVVTIRGGAMQPVPGSVVVILALVVGGVASQSFMEK